VRYAIEPGDYQAANCHCTMCRRTSAAPFVAWVMVPKDQFRIVAGAPREFQSSDHGSRGYCVDCGTPLVCKLESDPDTIDVTLCSFDDPTALEPTINVYADTELPWVAKTSELKRWSPG
jgi:hypothetical protein